MINDNARSVFNFIHFASNFLFVPKKGKEKKLVSPKMQLKSLPCNLSKQVGCVFNFEIVAFFHNLDP